MEVWSRWKREPRRPAFILGMRTNLRFTQVALEPQFLFKNVRGIKKIYSMLPSFPCKRQRLVALQLNAGHFS